MKARGKWPGVVAICGVLLAAGAALAAATTASAPATAVATPTPPPPPAGVLAGFASPAYPRAYDVLLTRSLFARGGTATPAPAHPRADGGATVDAAASHSAAPQAPAADPLIFRGAMREGGEFIAFIEDATTGKTQRVSADQAIGGGKVRQITLDRLTYEVHDRTRDVPVGSTLDGSAAADPTTRPSTQPAVVSGGSGGSGTSGAAAAPASPEDQVLERMRKRRQQEEAGK